MNIQRRVDFSLPITITRLGGEALTPAVMQRIEECDALVTLLTRRDQKTTGKWTTHDWVRDELNHARSKSMRAVAFVENEVEAGGAYAEHERIPLDRNRTTGLDFLFATV
jgi:hypothetical protein